MTISDAEIALQRRAARLVEREVHACMSSMVATLAEACGATAGHSLPRGGTRLAINDLAEQAMELASPVLDYEEAARQAGWIVSDSGLQFVSNTMTDDETGLAEAHGEFTGGAPSADDWRGLCEAYGYDAYENEVFEHWAVSQWLAEKLVEQGERVDTDFAGLNIWARTTTGQAISADSVIEAITAETGYASVPGPDMLDGEA